MRESGVLGLNQSLRVLVVGKTVCQCFWSMSCLLDHSSITHTWVWVVVRIVYGVLEPPGISSLTRATCTWMLPPTLVTLYRTPGFSEPRLKYQVAWSPYSLKSGLVSLCLVATTWWNWHPSLNPQRVKAMEPVPPWPRETGTFPWIRKYLKLRNRCSDVY